MFCREAFRHQLVSVGRLIRLPDAGPLRPPPETSPVVHRRQSAPPPARSANLPPAAAERHTHPWPDNIVPFPALNAGT